MALDLLAFAAHRDDTEITCGGLLALMVEKGYKVGACDLTQGEMGTLGSAPERQAECEEATRLLGLSVRVNCKLPDIYSVKTEEKQQGTDSLRQPLRPFIEPYYAIREQNNKREYCYNRNEQCKHECSPFPKI